MTEVYVSTDAETDGPIPGPHSMLSFASAAFTADKQAVGTFSANLQTLPGATAHPQPWSGGSPNPQPGPPAAVTRSLLKLSCRSTSGG